MKEYPSISRSFREFPAYVFDKLDGNNIRVEWTRKKGWFKFGCRHRLFDDTDVQFTGVKSLFLETMSEELSKVAVDNRWESVIVFAEFWGPSSLAGVRVPDEKMSLTLFDINPYKKGILGPKEFLDLVGDNPKIPTAKLLGHFNWTRGFVDRVWNGDVPGVTFEGVVGKGGSGHQLVMAKAKTKPWVEAIRARYAAEEAEKIVNS
jgi:hypothetical protein